MQIRLNKIIPIPLKDKLLQRKSDVWNTDLIFNNQQWIKINAPSGTGKTTLIHILYKLRNDYSGIVKWNDELLENINDDKLANYRKHKLSIVFQDLKLFQNLTAKENIELNRVLQKPYYEEKVIVEMAEELGVDSILQQPIRLCSYGEQQRIAIIRALIQPFELLLMDEPFSHLDYDNTVKAAALIAKECTKRNAGFVLTDLDDDNHFLYSQKLRL